MAHDGGAKAWLREQLSIVLGWDPFMAEGVVEALAAAQSQGDVDEIVQGYMGNDPAARAMVQQFQSGGPGGGASGSAGGGSGWRAYRKDGDAEQRYKAAAPSTALRKSQQAPTLTAGVEATPKGATRAGGALTIRHASAPKTAAASSGRGPAGSGGGGGAAVSSGRGEASGSGRSDGKGAQQVGGGRSGGKGRHGGEQQVPQLEKKVVNCLSCGKIYDCRKPSKDVTAFLDSGGLCTFCSARVALRYSEQSETHAPAAAAAARPTAAAPASSSASAGSSDAGAVAAAGTSGGEDVDARAAAAVALKERLVEYDRNSEQRTTVIDDQSDFFEVDSNAWLSAEEKAALRQRLADEEAAAEARRKRVTVTFDLMGRQVLLADDATLPSATDAAPATQPTTAPAARAAAPAAGSGASAGAAVPPAAAAAEDAQLADMRMRASPAASFSPLFLRPPPELARAAQKHAPPPRQAPVPVGSSRGQDAKGRGSGETKAPAPRGRQDGRGRRGATGFGTGCVQHDDPLVLLQLDGTATA